MELIIKQELAQAILNYLAEKPYRETYVFIAELQKLQQVPSGVSMADSPQEQNHPSAD